MNYFVKNLKINKEKCEKDIDNASVNTQTYQVLSNIGVDFVPYWKLYMQSFELKIFKDTYVLTMFKDIVHKEVGKIHEINMGFFSSKLKIKGSE